MPEEKTKYRVVQLIEGLGWDKSETSDVESWMQVRGHKLTGYHTSPQTRTELQNQPEFKGFAGPMWDGDAVRYENWAAYERLSA